MTSKIRKKDKLDAMLQMWNVLRDINIKRPWSSHSGESKLMYGLERELAKLLDIKQEAVEKPLLSRDQIVLLVERLKQVQGELRTLRTEANTRYEGNSILDALIEMLETKLKAIPVPANFDTDEKIELLKEGVKNPEVVDEERYAPE